MTHYEMSHVPFPCLRRVADERDDLCIEQIGFMPHVRAVLDELASRRIE